jgi:3-phosphoshikimate 1-carboxyvinyltransferase
LAGLSAQGKTRVIERLSTRDHTERMLKTFGANISINKNKITLNPSKSLVSPGMIYIPGDISSAAFFMVLAAIVPGSKVLIEQVSLNPGRSGIIKILKRMKAKIEVVLLQKNKLPGVEPVGNISVSGSKLKGAVISPSEIPSLIDELPILMVAACFAQGRTIIKGADELRVKETDRINSMVENLKRMGADILVSKVGSQEKITIKGGVGLRGANLKSFGDHRTAMSMIVAALAAGGKSRIDDVSCINKSFPGFLAALDTLLKS